MDSSVNRELLRVHRFLVFGSELSLVTFGQKSSFNSLFSSQNKFKTKILFLKSIQNLWSNVKNKSSEEQNKMADLIRATIMANHGNSIRGLSLVTSSLFQCQNGVKYSPFRALAVDLIRELFGPKEILELVVIFGRKRLDSSRALRHCFEIYYSRDFSEKEMEEILVFGSVAGWRHKDVIILCHIKENQMTRQLLRQKSVVDDSRTTVERRVAVLRSQSTKSHELMKALDSSLLEPSHWLAAANTTHRTTVAFWLKLLENVSDDTLLSVVSHVISKFPNNKEIVKCIVERMRTGNEFSKSFSKNLFLISLKKTNFLRINSNLSHCLENALQRLPVPSALVCPVLVLLDSSLDLGRRYLSSLEEKKRRREDPMDSLVVKDFIELFVQSFHCNGIKGGKVVPMTTADDQWDRPELRELAVDCDWLKRIIIFSEKQIEFTDWPKERKLIVIHVNRIEIKNLGFFRQNWLILNGFDCRAEDIVTSFFTDQ